MTQVRGRIVCALIAAAGCKGDAPAPHDAAPAAVALVVAAPPRDAAPAPDAAPVAGPVRILVWDFYLDETGKKVLAGYDTALDFTEGRACVTIGRADQLIDEIGNVVMKGKNFDCTDIVFENGVSTHDGKVIDRDGKTVATPTYRGKKPDELGRFAEGLAAARFGTKWGYIDRTGALVIPPTWGPDQPWMPGPGDEPGPEGESMEPPDYYDYADPFSDGMAAVRVGDQWGYIDKTGKIAVSPRFAELVFHHEFADGLAMFSDASGKKGWIDRTGAVAIPAQFDNATPFAEGVAGASRDGHWGYLDRTGTTVFTLDPTIVDADSFSDGLAMVHLGGARDGAAQFGFVDHTGKLVIPFQFANGGRFEHGVAALTIPNPAHDNMPPLDVLIDKTGKILWQEPR